MGLWIRIDGDDLETRVGRVRPFDGEWASLGEAIEAVRQFRRPPAGPTLQAHQDLKARVAALEGTGYRLVGPLSHEDAEAAVRAYGQDKAGRSHVWSGLCDLKHTCHAAARAAGWWSDLETGEPIQRNVGELLCLIHSEISEAMEAHRKGLQDDKLPHRSGLEVELADAVIRIADLCGGLDLDLAGAVVEKLQYNATRADHKPENRRTAGGKAY